MYSLIRRFLVQLGVVNDEFSGNYESAEFVDGASLGALDCRWSPNLRWMSNEFEETRPYAKPSLDAWHR